jgi:hypothetical protein
MDVLLEGLIQCQAQAERQVELKTWVLQNLTAEWRRHAIETDLAVAQQLVKTYAAMIAAHRGGAK